MSVLMTEAQGSSPSRFLKRPGLLWDEFQHSSCLTKFWHVNGLFMKNLKMWLHSFDWNFLQCSVDHSLNGEGSLSWCSLGYLQMWNVNRKFTLWKLSFASRNAGSLDASYILKNVTKCLCQGETNVDKYYRVLQVEFEGVDSAIVLESSMFHYFLSQNAEFHSQLIRGKVSKVWPFSTLCHLTLWFDWFICLLIDVIVGDEKAFVWLHLNENLSILLLGVSPSSKKEKNHS